PDGGFACVPPPPAAPAPCSKPSGLPCRRRSNSPLSHRPIRSQAKAASRHICSANDFSACCKALISKSISNQGVKVGSEKPPSAPLACMAGLDRGKTRWLELLLYPAQVRTRKSVGEMIRKLSVT